MPLSRQRLETLLARFPDLTVALVGDLFLDRYLEIEPQWDEASVETGLTAYQVARVRNSPGAMGTVMNNLAALGVGRLLPVTVIGCDGEAYDLLAALDALPVDAAHVVREPGRQTPTYTKPLRRQADGSWLELNRLDLKTRAPLAEASQGQLIAQLEQAFGDCDGLIVVDQVNEADQGVVNAAVRGRLEQLAGAYAEKLVLIDSRARSGEFRCGMLKPNAAECLAAAGLPAEATNRLQEAAELLCARTGQAVFCTLGEDGMLLVEPGGAATRVPAFSVEGPIDIVGAGDSATAAMTCALLAGAAPAEAAALGNLVASITIRKLGATGTATPAEVLDRWEEVSR